MNREQVQELEALVEQALASVFRKSKVAKGLLRNQLSPNAKTVHLMAKAAVTVLEATETEGK
ncbi:MAG TPA: hypothetical protein VGM98_08820 [Schlesneria sp.]|jgi:hypothetical protein